MEEITIYDLMQYIWTLHNIDNFTGKFNLPRKKKEIHTVLKWLRKSNESLKLNSQNKKKKMSKTVMKVNSSNQGIDYSNFIKLFFVKINK